MVKHLDPHKALVLFYDTALMKEQLDLAARAGVPVAPPNLRVTGRAMGSMTPPEFSISWAFVLEPTVEGGTRLIERFRLSGEMTGRAAAISGRMLGLGIFTMSRKQMLGIQTRAERVAREWTVLSSSATTIGRPPTTDQPEIRVRVKAQDLASEPTTNGTNEVEPVNA